MKMKNKKKQKYLLCFCVKYHQMSPHLNTVLLTLRPKTIFIRNEVAAGTKRFPSTWATSPDFFYVE